VAGFGGPMNTHRRMAVRGVIGAVGAVAAGMRATASAQGAVTPMEGVWRTIEVVVSGSPGPRYRPAANLAIFHGRHYSRVEIHADQPRPEVVDQATASADQLRAVWGPLVAEAGTFELGAGNTITMRPTVAKNPAAMRDGASSVYTYRREGDRLTLTQISNPRGSRQTTVIVTLMRVE
jgi:hypothetical protein